MHATEHTYTVSGSDASGYYVIHTNTGERVAGPFTHWREAFAASKRTRRSARQV